MSVNADAAQPGNGSGGAVEPSESEIWSEADEAEAKGSAAVGPSAASNKADAEAAAGEDGKSDDGKKPDEKTEGKDDKAKSATAETAADGKDKSAGERTDSEPHGDEKHWAKAPEDLRTARAAILKDLDKVPELKGVREGILKSLNTLVEARARSEGHQGTLQRQVNDLTAQIRRLTQGGGKTGDDKGDGKTKTAGFLESQEMKQFAEDYPEVAAIVKAAFTQLEGENKSLRERVDGVASRQSDSDLRAEYDLVLGEHEDYEQIAKSETFEEWYAKAPSFVQSVVERNARRVVNGREVADILNLFKQQTGWKPKAKASGASPGNPSDPDGKDKSTNGSTDPKRQRQLESSSSPRGKSTAVSRSQSESEDEAEIWKQIDEEESRRAATR
jgi:hypothetical protein